MTLGDMAAFVCAKVRQQDTTALARCKEFLARRYVMIWDDQLWKDSLFRLEFTFRMDVVGAASMLAYGNYFSRDGGVWQLPPSVDRVLALRKTNDAVPVNDQFRLYRETLDAFAETGEPVAFHPLPPAVADLSGSLSGVESEGVTLNSNAADGAVAVRVRYIDLDGEEQVTDINLPAAGGYSAVFDPQAILSMSKPATNEDVEVILDSEVVATFGAQETNAKKRARVRLMPMPVDNVDLAALVKVRAQLLSDDGDEPALRGIENCLLAFAQMDMLQRARQYGKAQLVGQEAVALLDQLKRIEVVQEAQSTQIVPEVAEPSGSIGWQRQKGWI